MIVPHPPEGASEFRVQGLEKGKWKSRQGPVIEGQRLERFPIAMLTEEFLKGFGPGKYRLQWVGGRNGYSQQFEMTAEAAAPSAPKPSKQPAPLPAAAPAVPQGGMGSFEQAMQFMAMLESARRQGIQETMAMMQAMREMVSSAAPAVPAGLTEAISRLTARLDEEEEEEDEEEEEEEGDEDMSPEEIADELGLEPGIWRLVVKAAAKNPERVAAAIELLTKEEKKPTPEPQKASGTG